MEIVYWNLRVEKQFNPAYIKVWKYSQDVKRRLLALGNYLQNAESLADVASRPAYRFHLLKGNLKGEWSISLGNTGFRVTVIPCDAEGNKIQSGDIAAQFKNIKVILITGVTNHYE